MGYILAQMIDSRRDLVHRSMTGEGMGADRGLLAGSIQTRRSVQSGAEEVPERPRITARSRPITGSLERLRSDFNGHPPAAGSGQALPSSSA